EGLDSYVLGIIIGTVFTALVQSSSATTGVVIVLAMQGLIRVDAGIAIIFGANIGTCVTAVLSAIGKPRAAMRVAVSHVLFKFVGVLCWYAFIPQLTELVNSISGENAARQIANAHTFFNVVNTFVFIWLVHPVARLVLWLVPTQEKKAERVFPELHSYYLEDTSIALDLSHVAITKLGNYTVEIIKKGLQVAFYGSTEKLIELRKDDEKIDRGHAEILQFHQQIQGKSISQKDSKRLEYQIEAVNVLETAADLITTNLVEATEHRIVKEFEASKETEEKISGLYNKAIIAFNKALLKYSKHSKGEPANLDKQRFKEEFQEVRSYLVKRLQIPDDKRIEIYRFESELLEVTRRIHALARRLDRKA
uniref:Na/Pi cotransporter family protein n=1 Tax=Draconibacterium sp. TaxID=1965318 RepID=UPI003565A30B